MHENPELIWTDGVREKVRSTVRTMKDEWHTTLLHDRGATWRLPDDYENVYQGTFFQRPTSVGNF
jgi:hypothetical protein